MLQKRNYKSRLLGLAIYITLAGAVSFEDFALSEQIKPEDSLGVEIF